MKARYTIFIFIIMLAFNGCFTTTNLKVPEKEYIQGNKKILIMPIYLDKDLFPVMPPELSGMEFNEQTKELVKNKILERENSISDIAADTLKNSRFNIEPVLAKIDLNETSKYIKVTRDDFSVMLYLTKEIKLRWNVNLSYDLDEKYIKELCDKYQVDAIYFQYFQVRKIWYTGYDKSITPLFALEYNGSIYSKENKTIFTTKYNPYISSVGEILNSPNRGYAVILLEYLTRDKGFNKKDYFVRYPDENIKERLESAFSDKKLKVMFVSGPNAVFYGFGK